MPAGFAYRRESLVVGQEPAGAGAAAEKSEAAAGHHRGNVGQYLLAQTLDIITG